MVKMWFKHHHKIQVRPVPPMTSLDLDDMQMPEPESSSTKCLLHSEGGVRWGYSPMKMTGELSRVFKNTPKRYQGLIL